jgi:4-hydroxy-tetrahydrodipicolinate synthase
MGKTIEGVLTAIVTPFDGDDKVDRRVLRAQVERQIRHGNGVFCAGTNGEFFALETAEKIAVAETCVEAAAGRAPVIAHIGEVSTAATIALGRAVAALGVDAVSVITPWFVPLSQDDLVAHFSAVADAVPAPVFIYNIPPRTGNTIAPATAARLAGHGNIVGVKDSAGAQDSLDGFLAVARDRNDFDVLVGPDSLIHHGLVNGAVGSISGLGNLIPATINAIVAAARAGDRAAGERHQAHCSDLRRVLYALGFAPTMVKRALALVLPEIGASRAPIRIPPEIDAQIRAIADAFVEI